jgi:hypothetical protein
MLEVDLNHAASLKPGRPTVLGRTRNVVIRWPEQL